MIGILLFVLVVLDINKVLTRKLIDFLGLLCILRCLFDFYLLNILLLYPLKDITGGLFLLLELIIFLPQVSLAFTWLYWRLDAYSRKKGKILLIFDNEPPEIFDYFEISAKQILQFDPAIVKSRSIGMRLLLITHSIMMLDLLALVISRAVSLTSGQY